MTVVDPIITAQKIEPLAARIDLLVPPDLDYFDGHFPGLPIVPGVVQVKWALLLARKYLDAAGAFAGIEALKFHRVMTPGARPTLILELAPANSKLRFSYESARSRYSSGRLLFRATPSSRGLS